MEDRKISLPRSETFNFKSRSGKIEHINKDKSPMNKEKEKFLEFMDLYQNIGRNVKTSLETLKLFNDNDKVKKICKYAPAFTTAIVSNIWKSSVVSIHAFFSWGDKRSLNRFLNYIEANHNKIFTGEFYERVDWGDEIEDTKFDFDKKTVIDEVKESRQIIEDNKILIIKIKKFRHTYYAHFGEPDEEDKVKYIYLKELEEALNLIEKIVRKFQVRYDRVVKSFRLMNVGDVKQIGHILELYENNKAELIKADRERRYGV
jgi:hypothetical protein